MFEEHPTFRKPENENIKIWRYMNLPKFLSLLDKKSLFFTRADKFEDPYEGVLPKYNEFEDNRLIVYEQDKQKFQNNKEFEKTILETAPQSMKYALNNLKKTTLINSWHMNDYESAAMWDLYSHRNSGIAIQSRYKNLKKSFDTNQEDSIWIGTVNYIDYEKEWMSEWNLYEAFVIKRKSFEHEQEIRVVTSLPENFGKPVRNTQDSKKMIRKIDPTKLTPVGKYVDVNLDELIDAIYLSPLSSPDYKDIISDLQARYNLKKPIIVSNLYSIS